MEQNVNGKKRIGIMVKGLLPFYFYCRVASVVKWLRQAVAR